MRASLTKAIGKTDEYILKAIQGCNRGKKLDTSNWVILKREMDPEKKEAEVQWVTFSTEESSTNILAASRWFLQYRFGATR